MPRAAKPPPGPLSLAVSSILRAQMGRKNMTKVALAAASGIDRTMVTEIMLDHQIPDIEQLEAICIALDLRLTKTIREAENATEGRQFSGGTV